MAKRMRMKGEITVISLAILLLVAIVIPTIGILELPHYTGTGKGVTV